METKTLPVKYSIFGGYDFINNTPKNVSELYGLFEEDDFMPNIITLYKIEQPQNNVTLLERPQLINKAIPCTISFLPERIDIEIELSIELTQVLDYLEKVVNLFDLEINRFALFKTTVFDDLDVNKSDRLNEIIASPTNYSGEDNLIEYESRRVNRVKFDCLNELVNINRTLSCISSVIDGKNVFDKLQVVTDINTRGENTKNRFGVEDCQGFFETAFGYDAKILDTVEKIIDE